MDVAHELTLLVAAKLIVYTFGSLTHLFLMVLILGQRRMRRLEWLLFVLMASLFMWNVGNLLALNVGLFYGVGPDTLAGFSRVVPFIGLVVSAPLIVHVHAEYASRFTPARWPIKLATAAFYLPAIAAPWGVGKLLGNLELDPLFALSPYHRPMAAWLVAAQLTGAALNFLVGRRAREARLARLHSVLLGLQVFLAAGIGELYIRRPLPIEGLGGGGAAFLLSVAIVPSMLLGYAIFRYNFLELRIQRNLVYSLVTVFALLIYFGAIRRLSSYLELLGNIPAVATETFMIFILVVLFEPVKKQIDRILHEAFVSGLAPVQKLSKEVYEFAKKAGDVGALKNFIEERTARELGLGRVELRSESSSPAPEGGAGRPSKTHSFPIHRGEEVVGQLEVEGVTAVISGEQFGALEFLADQLTGAIELCQLIADKVLLERALAEKEKMAFLGEMSARIAHNVKNPLSAMKTLVQLQEEDPSLPDRVREDCRLVIQEIDRLNSNITQVLRYAKPARDTDRPADLAVVVRRTVTLSDAEAQGRQVKLQCETPYGSCPVEGGEEAANDIVSNLVVNALQAAPAGGSVSVRVAQNSGEDRPVELWVENDGPPILADVKEKIFQPFFTTRAGGTGLGLAIVTRRAEEIGGAVECVSPTGPEGGTRFVVRFRAAG